MDLDDCDDFKPPKMEPTDTEEQEAKPRTRPSSGGSAGTVKLEKRPMTCTRCSAVFTKRPEWIEHVRKHPAKTPGKSIVCPHDGCDFATTMDYNLKGHIRAAHTNEKPFKCDSCDAAFARKSDFNRHVQRVHEKKTYDCPECDHVAKNVEKLKQHVKEEHGKVVTTESLCCHRCGKACLSRPALLAHIKQHEALPKKLKERELRCPVHACGFVAKRSDQLQMHHRSAHENVKPYGCDFCDYRTAYKQDATRHMRRYHAEELLAVKTEDVKPKKELSHVPNGVKREYVDALLEEKQELEADADFAGGTVAKKVPKVEENAAGVRPSRKRSAKRTSIWYGDDESDASSDEWNDSLEDDTVQRGHAKRFKKQLSASKEATVVVAAQPALKLQDTNLMESPLESFLREEEELNRRFFAGKSVTKP